MRITESKLRKMIRGVIKEFQGTTGTALGGAKPKGYKSAGTGTAQSDYDTKSADYTTKAAAVDVSKRYRRAVGKGKYTYSATPAKGYSTNPAYTTQVSNRDAASTAKDTAQSTLSTRQTSDTSATIPTVTPPAVTSKGTSSDDENDTDSLNFGPEGGKTQQSGQQQPGLDPETTSNDTEVGGTTTTSQGDISQVKGGKKGKKKKFKATALK